MFISEGFKFLCLLIFEQQDIEMNDRKDIPALTGIRGIAAIWVVIYHVHEFDSISGRGAILLRHGYLAVDIFFVLFEAGFNLRRYTVFLLRPAARNLSTVSLDDVDPCSHNSTHAAADPSFLHLSEAGAA